jgi:hypothetical protein
MLDAVLSVVNVASVLIGVWVGHLIVMRMMSKR